MFEEYTEDTWSISMDGKELVRYHISPRKHLFNPRDAADIPVDIENLKPTRYTQEPLGGLSWTGHTKFELFEPVKPKDRKPKQKVHQLARSQNRKNNRKKRPQKPKHQRISMNLQENCHSILEDMSTTSKAVSRP